MSEELVPADRNEIKPVNAWPYNPEHYTHPTDRAALNALKAVPGFHQLMRAIMKVWNERLSRVKNMSSMVRINQYQLPEYYSILPPICEKLGIEIPEMYLDLNVFPNAYTGGDTKPYIVVTSGLFETLPEDLVPTVIAHECGHIACHHVLYGSIANIIKNGTFNLIRQFIPFGGYATIPIEMAFLYWSRCSELSADRAAILYDGTSEKTFEVCMRFAGYDKDIKGTFNKREFLIQAKEYRDMIDSNVWNSSLESILLMNEDHPLSVVRALEAVEFEKSEAFDKIRSGEYIMPDKPEEETEQPEEKKAKHRFEFPKFGKKKDESDPDNTETDSDHVIKEILKYKELFDEGILTEEEFAAKKRQLLEL